MKTAYIYLTNKEFDNTVFVTQISDWLNLYQEKGVDFTLLEVFFYRSLLRKGWKGNQKKGIITTLQIPSAFSVAFPSRGLFVWLNALLWSRIIKRIAKDANSVVLMSRDIYGKEISLIRKFLAKPVYFIYDARAASVEENIFSAVKSHSLSKKKFDVFHHITYTEYRTLKEADTVFAVSNQLKRYLIRNYDVSKQRFFIYPCLSDAQKFYYNKEIRNNYRKQLGYTDEDMIILYAGGLANAYHGTSTFMEFINQIAKSKHNTKFLLLSRDKIEEHVVYERYPNLSNRILIKSAANSEMVNYYNAADLGLLLRENVPMNNVASPSKFAEYMLCGLPTIISEGVGDYSSLCVENHLGIVIKEDEMNHPSSFDFSCLDEYKPSDDMRERIAQFGFNHLSKQARIDAVVKKMKSIGNEH